MMVVRFSWNAPMWKKMINVINLENIKADQRINGENRQTMLNKSVLVLEAKIISKGLIAVNTEVYFNKVITNIGVATHKLSVE